MTTTNTRDPNRYYPVTTWMGWVDEYPTDQGEVNGYNPERYNDLKVYLTHVWNPDVEMTLEGVLTDLGTYQEDAPNVEDPDVYARLGWTTITDLMGYLSMRYENQGEVEG